MFNCEFREHNNYFVCWMGKKLTSRPLSLVSISIQETLTEYLNGYPHVAKDGDSVYNFYLGLPLNSPIPHRRQ